MGEHLIVKYYNDQILQNNNHVHLNIKKKLTKDLYGMLYLLKMNHYIIHTPHLTRARRWVWHCPSKPQTGWWWRPWLSCSHQRANNNQVKGALVLYNFKTKLRTQNQVFCKIIKMHLHLHGPWKINTWGHWSVFFNFLHYSCVNVSAIEKVT